MDTTELNFLNILKTDFELSDEKTTQVVDFFKKLQKDSSDSLLAEIKTLFKEDFHKLELKLEQQNTKLEQFKAELDSKLEQFKAELNLKLEQHKSDNDLKLEQFKAEINLKFKEQETNLEKFKAELHSKLDNNKFDLELKIEKSKTISVRWFMGLSAAVILMILGLYATIIFKFLV